MSQILIEQALKIFEGQERLRQPPSLAILGPPGSGKSLFLQQLLNAIRKNELVTPNSRPAGDDRMNDVGDGFSPRKIRKHSLMLDLREMIVGSRAELYAHINQTLIQEAGRNEITLNPRVPVIANIPDLRFEEIMRQLVSSIEGYLIIFIDHLESVPRFFASDLSQTFRNFLETADQDSAYARLGLVVAGAVSLFELKHHKHSAFQSLKLFPFPPTESEIQKTMVEDYLKTHMSARISSELTDLLADLTGGEPAFLEPLMMHLVKRGQQISLNEELVLSSVEQICSFSQVPVLRNLALHLWGDVGLREIIRDLRESRAVMPRFAVPDMDRYQLSGAVILGRGPQDRVREYQFRNRFAAQFLGRLYKLLENNGSKSTDLLIWSELQKLESAKTNCLSALHIWNWMTYLRDAWVLITPYIGPNIVLYVSKMGSEYGWWINGDLKGISGAEVRESATTSMHLAAFNALDHISVTFGLDTQNVKAFVEADTDRISIALPLYAREMVVILVATLLRSDALRGFTEFDLCHWIRFLQNVKHLVPNLILAEFGKKILEEPAPEPEQSLRAVNYTPTTHITLLRQGGAVVKDSRGITELSRGTVSADDRDSLNNSCLRLVDSFTDHKKFEEGIRGIARQLENALNAEFRELSRSLVPESRSTGIVVASEIDGLKIPFELFPHAKTHLSLLTGVSRQIMGYKLEPEAAFSFHYLIRSLAASKKKTLRVLLVEASEDQNDGDRGELTRIRSYIEAGCRRDGLRAQIVEIRANEANIKRVETELTENGPYHIFHYCGHGQHFSEDQDASGLVLLNEQSEPYVVKTKRLRAWFTEAKPWLVYLSCCQSAAASGSGLGLSSRYVGMIEAAIAAGVPNVVGFRCMVSDQAAFHLADEFYRQLFKAQKEKDLSLAILEARRSVQKREDFFDSWASSLLVTQYV